MGLALEIEQLTSRVIRSKIGNRIIKAFESKGANTGNAGTNTGDGGILDQIGKVFNGLGSLAGWLLEPIANTFASFSWSKFWSYCVSVKQFIWNFNFNATDKSLEAAINTKWDSLLTQVGGALGQAFGYLACGILPGAVIFAFNEPMGAFVLEKVSEEFVDEFTETLASLMNSALVLGTQIAITETYKSVRKLIKSESKLIGKIFGNSAEKAVEAWGAEGSLPWSFAIATENALDKLFGTEGAVRNAAEEFLEEADEACVEAGYVVANAVDTFLAADMLSRRVAPALGNTRYVEITPNRDVPDERIVLGGREELLRPQIIQTLATYEQFNGRDMGTIYGTPSADIAERRHRPEVVLKFYCKQNKNSNKGAITDALSMQISFRLMNKTKDDFVTDDYAKLLAAAIYREFATPPYEINKGTQTYTYADHEKGYQMKLDVDGRETARRVINKILDIQNHTFNDDYFRVGSKVADNSNAIPDIKGEKVTVLGREERLPVRGKVGTVKFSYAYLNLGIQVKPIDLVDLTGKRTNNVFDTIGK